MKEWIIVICVFLVPVGGDVSVELMDTSNGYCNLTLGSSTYEVKLNQLHFSKEVCVAYECLEDVMVAYKCDPIEYVPSTCKVVNGTHGPYPYCCEQLNPGCQEQSFEYSYEDVSHI